MINIFQDVADFNAQFKQTVGRRSAFPSDREVEFRKDRIREEAAELCEALDERDLVKVACEAVDSIYVTLGALVICGLPFWEVWQAVHEANLEKVPNPTGGKPLKPEGWCSPEERVRALLEERGYG